MQLYSIMPLDTAHVEKICEDIERQYRDGVCDCALFMFRLVPEGNPVIDKAKIQGEKYAVFRDRLAQKGLSCGILVQCTIGHGYPLNEKSPFEMYVGLTDGQVTNVCCPYDEGARSYFRDQMATLASLCPKVIMVDDDFRLMYRGEKGCACSLHMKAVNERLSENLDRAQLFEILKNEDDPRRETVTEAYIETQRDALLGAACAMREGIDSVDPTLPGVFCSVGHTTEFGGEIAKILAGEGNPSVVRINNGNYTPEGARYLSKVSFRCAQQAEILRRAGVDVILAETDTCPQNRYSTGAQSLHAHFVASILEGANGAKHWITRLNAFEPSSGVAYRKKLSSYRNFYSTLAETVPNVRWQGCRIPFPQKLDYGFTKEGWYQPSNDWARSVLERMGIPLYYSSEQGGAVCLEGSLEGFGDDELCAMCGGVMLIASDSAAELCERGFGDALGVDVEPWNGAHTSGERIHINGQPCAVQMGVRCLIPQNERVRVASTVYHLKDGKNEIPLFPGVTVYENSMGGRAIIFAGTPKARFKYYEAFSFLNESRKEQLVSILKEAD